MTQTVPNGVLRNRSHSGLRGEDGVVVFAMAASEVRSDDWGFSCLLWAPVARGVRDLRSCAERLAHCRLAVRDGMAEGFLVYSDEAAGRAGEALALRVVKAGREYWAKWGSAARAMAPAQALCAAGVRP